MIALVSKNVIIPIITMGVFVSVVSSAFGYSFYQQHDSENVRYVEPAPMNTAVYSSSSQLSQPTPYITSVPDNDSDITRKDVREKLRTLFSIHAMLAGLVTEYRYDNTQIVSSAQQLADQNTGEIFGQLEKVYGTSTRNDFATLWKQHMDLFMQYTDALHSKDENKRGLITNQLIASSNAMAAVFGKTMPSKNIQTALQNHIELESSVIDAHAGGNYSLQYAQMDQAIEQARTLADVLVP